MPPVALSLLDLMAAAVLLLLSGLASLVFRLGLERSLAVAALRMVVQLSLVGFVLKLIFERASPLWTAIIALVMVAVAGYEVLARQTYRFRGPWAYGLGSSALLGIGSLTCLYAALAVVGSNPWHNPRVILPILGMILGNTLTSMALALETLTLTARDQRPAVEARLALGTTRYQALQGPLVHALKTALMPMINSMAVAGIVALPGMMTGQILAGVEPVEAVKYQLAIMFLLAGATALGAVLAGLAGVWLLTDRRHRLRLDALERNRA